MTARCMYDRVSLEGDGKPARRCHGSPDYGSRWNKRQVINEGKPKEVEAGPHNFGEEGGVGTPAEHSGQGGGCSIAWWSRAQALELDCPASHPSSTCTTAVTLGRSSGQTCIQMGTHYSGLRAK